MNLEDLAHSESFIRVSSFTLILSLMLCWEKSRSLRPLKEAKVRHDIRNLIMVIVSAVLMRLVLPILPVGVAIVAQEKGWGLLNAIHLTPWVTAIGSVLALDLVIYFQHRLFHAMPTLWRLHRVHHTDFDLTASSGLRFHPLEIFLSIGVKMAAVVALGAPPSAVLAFEVILNGAALFNHGNVCIPHSVDRILRFFLVTPDMHRVHHSSKMLEQNKNFGFNFPWWDRFFGSYLAQPDLGHHNMKIGIDAYQDIKNLTIQQLLLLPFKKL